MFSIDPLLQMLSKAVDVAALRHSVHVTNVANVNTEGYSRFEVVVDSLSPDGAGADGVGGPEPRVVSVPGEAVRLDEEMAAMTQNAVRYQALLNAIEGTMSALRSAAREGRE